MPSTEEPTHDRFAELAWQQSRVDVLASKLAQAERVVGQARTAAASADAHRRADALLLELEAAENDLRTLEELVPRERPVRHARPSPPPADQGHLFDVG